MLDVPGRMNDIAANQRNHDQSLSACRRLG
jgi:hypothetical protein